MQPTNVLTDTLPDAQTVQTVVADALSAPEFERSPRMRTLLRYLVDETLAGRGDRLKGYTIGVDVFEKPPDFDPNADALVRVEVGRLRRILANHFDTASAGPSHAIEIPRGAYQVHFRPRADSTMTASTELLARPTGPQVVVDPFLNQSPGALNDSIAVGVAAELTDQLSRFRHMFVQSRSNAELQQVAEEGHYNVSGTVALIDDQLRVVATLTDNTKRAVVWSREFRSPTTPGLVLATQREISQMIAGAVGHAYGPVTRAMIEANQAAPASTWEAWTVQAIWQAYRYQRPPDGSPEEAYAALRDRIDTLLERDPLSPALIAIRARMTIELAWASHTPDLHERLDRARLELLSAVGHDPNSAQAWRELAVVESMVGNATAADDAFARALELHPSNLEILFAYAFHLGLSHGQWHDAWPLVNKAADLGFVSPLLSLHLYVHHLALGEPKAALFEARKLDWPWHPMMLARAMAHANVDDMAGAALEVRRLLEHFPDYESWAGDAIGLWVRTPQLRAIVEASAAKAGLTLGLV